jgi:hypothetical protein
MLLVFLNRVGIGIVSPLLHGWAFLFLLPFQGDPGPFVEHSGLRGGGPTATTVPIPAHRSEKPLLALGWVVVVARVPKFWVRTTPILLLKIKGVVRFRSRFRIPNLAKRVGHIFKRNCPKESFIFSLEIVQKVKNVMKTLFKHLYMKRKYCLMANYVTIIIKRLK